MSLLRVEEKNFLSSWQGEGEEENDYTKEMVGPILPLLHCICITVVPGISAKLF